MRLKNAGSILLTGEDPQTGPYFATRFQPDLPADAVSGSPRAVFLVDVSLSSNPARFNIWLKLMKAILENNRDSLKEFAVLFFNIDGFWWQEKFVANTPENAAALLKHCETLALEGATNLRRALAEGVKPSWQQAAGKQPPADLFLLSPTVSARVNSDPLGPDENVVVYAGGFLGFTSIFIDTGAFSDSETIFAVGPRVGVEFYMSPTVAIQLQEELTIYGGGDFVGDYQNRVSIGFRFLLN